MKIELKPFFTFLKFNTPFFKVFFGKNSLFRDYNVIEKGKILAVACKFFDLNLHVSKTFPSDFLLSWHH